MSDAGRKDFSDKVQEKVTPESSKSTTDKISEGFTNTTDSAARNLQSDSSKSGTQELSDKATGQKHHEQGSGDSTLNKVKDAVGLGNKS